jgi:hypothetical protein
MPARQLVRQHKVLQKDHRPWPKQNTTSNTAPSTLCNISSTRAPAVQQSFPYSICGTDTPPKRINQRMDVPQCRALHKSAAAATHRDELLQPHHSPGLIRTPHSIAHEHLRGVWHHRQWQAFKGDIVAGRPPRLLPAHPLGHIRQARLPLPHPVRYSQGPVTHQGPANPAEALGCCKLQCPGTVSPAILENKLLCNVSMVLMWPSALQSAHSAAEVNVLQPWTAHTPGSMVLVADVQLGPVVEVRH